jgi:serine/threonine-protein kinase
MVQRMEGYRFEQVAIARGFIASEQLEEARRIQEKVREAGLEIDLEEICVKKKWLSHAHLAAIHALVGGGERDLIPGYEILGRLGRGGMGTVYKARQAATGRIVAVKILLPHFANERDAVQRFRREASILCQVHHKNIVEGLDAGFHNGIYYYVMEFVEGGPLSHRISQIGKIDWKEAIGYMKQMAEALSYAEMVRLVHRDIKPDNILIAPDGEAKLMDLGLAKMTMTRPHTTLTETGWMVGTPAYMSPEQMTAGKDADIRADLYSLGMTFFTALTGSAAYQGDSTVEVMQQRITHEIPYKKLALAGVPENLTTIMRHLTVKDRGFRYQSPSELMEDLLLVERGEPPLHARKLPTSRTATVRITQRFIPLPPPPAARRSRRIVLAGALAGVLAFGLIVLAVHNFRPDPAEAAYRSALEFEKKNPDRVEDVLDALLRARPKVAGSPKAAGLEERIGATRARLKREMDHEEGRVRESVLRHLEARQIPEARRAVDQAATAFRCPEWKQVCDSLQALVVARSN